MRLTLFYVHDPMCSWCWGYRPVLDRVMAQLPDTISCRRLLGGLAPDSDVPMAQDMREGLQQIWQRIHQQLGTEFNFDFWTQNTPRRSTYPACRAVIAATSQGAGDAMSDAIQRAYYLRAMNPSDTAVHCQLAGELGLDVERFASDIASDGVEQMLRSQLVMSRKLGVMGFPSWVLWDGQQAQSVPLDYSDPAPTVAAVTAAVTAAAMRE